MTTPNEGAEMTNLMDFADEYAKQVADAPVTNNIPQRQFAISQISAARDALSDAIAACDARHRQELAAYELTVSNLRAELAAYELTVSNLRAELAAYELTVSNLRAELAQRPERKPLISMHRRWIAATCLTPASIIDAVEAAHGIKGD